MKQRRVTLVTGFASHFEASLWGVALMWGSTWPWFGWKHGSPLGADLSIWVGFLMMLAGFGLALYGSLKDRRAALFPSLGLFLWATLFVLALQPGYEYLSVSAGIFASLVIAVAATKIDLSRLPPKEVRTMRDFERTVFGHALERTFAKRGREALEWSQHVDNIIDLWGTVLDANSHTKLNSVVGFRAMELFRNMLWVQQSALHGAYQAAIRELRYSLEAMVHAVVVDGRLPEAPMEEKFLEIENLDGLIRRRKESIKTGFLAADISDVYDGLYKELSKYAHATPEELRHVLVDGDVGSRVVFDYEPKLFDLTRDLSRRTMDVILYLILTRFPEDAKTFKEKPLVIESLKAMEQVRTLSLLNKVA